MTQTHQSLKAKLLRLQSLLASDSKPQATSSAVQQLTQLFRRLDIKNEKVAKQVYEEVRETVKGVLGLAEKCKYPLQCMSVLQKLIRELLLAISNFCSLFYCIYHPNGCGDMVKEFLASDCRLFVPEFAAPLNRNPPLAESQTQQGTPAWLWARQTGFKTLFFSECVQTIMRNLVHFQQRFGEMPVSVIGQYLRLLYYIEDHVVQQKLINLCLQHVEALQQLFTSPSKQTMKDANKEKLEQIVQHLTKLLRHSKNDQAKKRVQLLGALLGMSMLKLHSIEKKIVGCKIVSKFAYEMLYRNTSYITEASFCEWVVAQGFFALVFEDNCQTSLVKACEDTFKLLVKKSTLKKEQFQRFFQILEKSQLDLRKAMFRLIDPFRVDYYQIQTMLEIFKTLRGAEFYDDQFFYFLQGLSRYSTQLQITSMLAIIESIISQHYGRFESYLTKRRSVECYSYVFQRLITYKEPEQRIGSYVKVAEDFVSGPSLNKLIMLKTLFQNLTEHKMDRSMQQTLCDKIILQVKFIEKSLKLISQPTYKGDLITTIKIMLKKYGMRFNKQPFTVASLVQCVGYPEIFEEMLKLINSSEEQQLQGLFEQLANLTTLQDFSFSCVKSVFIKLNLKNLRPVKKQYTDVICTYVTYFNPASFLGLQTLKYLIFNSKKPSIRQGASQLLVEIYTNLSDDFREQGQVYLVEFMKSIVLLIRHKFKQFLEKASEIDSVKGSLELIEELLLNTEYFGVGSLKAHNSLIPTSTVSLKVFNNSTYGDDVLKIFQKKFPSNKTLFDVIAQVSKQFKIGPLDICLEFPNASSIKYNGLTLQELKLNKQELNAIKLPQSRVKKQPLLLDGALSPRAVKVFTDMFNKYAPNGKMSSKECAKYIEGVTLSFCPTFDSRITSFFAQYDADKDGILLLQDFIKFYKESLLDPEKAEVVEKNLANLRYRRDLKLYDQPIDSLNQEVIFRYHIWNNKDIYDYLFKFTNNQDSDICSAAQALLLRLPTYPKMAESLAQQLNLKEKKPFEVEYLLTTLESQIVSDSSVSQKLIKSRNHLAIFEYLSQLCSKQVKITNQKNCLIISLHLLHSLLGLKKESEGLLLQFPKLAFDLPKTQVFLNIIRESIKTGESTLLQPAFSLQLTQNQMPFDWIQESAFNKDKDTRYLTCGFLYLWTLKNKSKDLNLFKIKINQTRNQQWFNFLALIMSIGIQIDYLQLFTSKITQISSLSQSLEGLRFNPIIHGNLKLIKELYYRLQTQQKDILYTTLTALMPSLISNQNRELAYQLMLRDYPLQTLAILQNIAGVKIGKEAQPRNKFVGIKNLGCICYMNSILQQFFMIKQFLALITQLQPNTQEAQINGITIIDDFLYQLQSLYLHLQWSQKQYYDPTKFCLTIKDGQGKPVNTHIQEDAHQFLNTAFDKIETYAKKQEKQKILQKIFGGKTVTEIICQSCKNKVQVLEHFHHLTVEVKGMKTLKESFDKLITAEQISDYFCVNCDKRVQKITKQTLIKQAPEILIINLQRIIFDLQTFLKVKVHTKLQFEQTLDLHNYFSSSTKPAPYKLKGVVIHSGTSEGGHYYSLIKQDGKWYKFNDQSVTAFNQIDLGRQAFGGQEQTDTLGDFTSSNNAYILMYEKVTSADELQPQESKPLLNKQMYQQVLKQNREFKAQLQMYQASFFATLNTLFQKYIDQKDTKVLVTLFDIHLKVIQDLSVNSDVKTQTISQIKENFLKLCSVLPQRTKAITQVIDKASFGELICANNDVNIRQVYSKVLAKVLTTSVQSESSQLSEQSKLVVLHVISLLESDLLVKNIFKSLQFFQLCKELANLKQIKAIMLESGCLDKLLDLLLGSDSVHSTKQKKRSEFSPSEATPVVSVITTLLKDKVNLLGHRKDKLQGQKYYELTDRQKKIFNDPQFYRKMMRNKLDMGLIFAIIELLCYKDENYSKFIIQVLLKAMNNNDEIQDKSVVFANLKAFLLTEDQLWEQRLKWGLGVAQLDSISSSRHQFGMMTSAQSKVYSYVSALLFVKEEKVMPLLSSLFDKRKYYNSFSVHGILSLLQLMSQSKRVLAYILSLPAPTYIHKTYLDWIDAFATKIRKEQHYNLPYSKDLLSQKFSRLAEVYRQDLHRLAIADAIPVNKWIIGKNAAVVQKDSIVAQSYSITLQQHQTYVLKNRPYGLGNFQLPDHEFAFSSTSEKTSRYFLKSVELLAKEPDQLAQQKVFQRAFEGTQKGIQGTQKGIQGTQKVTQGTQKVTQGTQKGIEKQWTVLTFSIKCSIPMEIKFKMQHFQHTIHLKTGESTVYCPYEQGNLAQLIQITVREQELEAAAEIQSQPGKAEAMSSQAKGYSGAADYDYFSTIEVYCSYCSHLNFGVYQCVACDTDLFK